MSNDIPATEYAVQLVGPNELTLNTEKAVPQPGYKQMLLKSQAVGLCFSDLKLLKQFAAHVRKGPVVGGIDSDVLDALPSYVPGETPGVPGHEVVATIVAVGDDVHHHTIGEQVLVQADWREIRTEHTNAAFGYDFEGGLQEYFIVDERIVMEQATGQRYLIPVEGDVSASAVALVEPWACVEDSYVNVERNTLKAGGKLLVVCEEGCEVNGVNVLSDQSTPAEMDTIPAEEIASQPDEAFDDIIYFGADAGHLEMLNAKLAKGGMMNVVACGEAFDRPVKVDVGKVHYSAQRWCGTPGDNAAESLVHIPETGELRDDDAILVVGAGGPMGQMHVIRCLSAGKKNIVMTATDFDTPRLESLGEKTNALAEASGATLHLVNPEENPLGDAKFSYIALMAPIPALVTQAVSDAADGCLINIFAGIPAGTTAELDMNAYLANHCWMFGTSGSTIKDMKIVLGKVLGGSLDTNLSVDAVCGMAGAIDGIRAVEARSLAGKIIVYPELRNLPLLPLETLHDIYPTVAEKMNNGCWTAEAEAELLNAAS